MPRNGSGSYSLPEPPFVPLTTISSAAVNSDYSDIASALTASLARDGQGGMTDILPLNTAGFTYTNDLNTGMSRTGADAQAIKCGGIDIVSFTPTSVSVAGSFDATAIKQGGITLLPVGLGPLPWSGTAAPSGWVLCYGQALSRTAYAALWAFAQTEIALGNLLYTNGDGSGTFTVPDLRGRMPAGKDNMGGSEALRMTSVSMTPNGITMGAIGGTQTITLTQAQLPAVSPTFTGTPLGGGISFGTDPSLSGDAGNLRNIPSAFNSYTPAGTISALGSGQAHLNVQPTIISTYILFAGV